MRICKFCGQTVPSDCDQLPEAVRTFVQFLGRNLYLIDGTAGLYWMRMDNDPKDAPVVVAKRPTARGNSWTAAEFIRCREAENRLRKAFVEKAEVAR